MGDLKAAVTALRRVVDELSAADLAELVEPEATDAYRELRRLGDAVLVVAARVLARVAADGGWAQSRTGRSARDLPEWLTRDAGSSRSSARAQAELAKAVDGDVPGLAEAVTAGRVTLEHAGILARLAPTSPARREALVNGDDSSNAGFLLERAQELPADEFAREVKRWAARQDPEADERGHRGAAEKVFCAMTQRTDGWAVSAFLTTVDGSALKTALDSVAGVPSANDDRTPLQRSGAALGELARVVLDHGLGGRSGGVRPHLTVHVGLETLVAQVGALTRARGRAERAGQTPSGSADSVPEPAIRADVRVGPADGRVGPADGRVSSADGRVGPADGRVGPAEAAVIPAGWEAAVLADGEPIPASVLARLACDSVVSRVVFGPDSQVLDVGRAERLYNGAVRRAVVARDKHCRYPGCFRPPALGEIHHVMHWAAEGGETSVANGMLLCWHHHDLIHSRRISITKKRDAPGWEFRERDGSPVLPHGRTQHEALDDVADSPAEAGCAAQPPLLFGAA